MTVPARTRLHGRAVFAVGRVTAPVGAEIAENRDGELVAGYQLKQADVDQRLMVDESPQNVVAKVGVDPGEQDEFMPAAIDHRARPHAVTVCGAEVQKAPDIREQDDGLVLSSGERTNLHSCDPCRR